MYVSPGVLYLCIIDLQLVPPMHVKLLVFCALPNTCVSCAHKFIYQFITLCIGSTHTCSISTFPAYILAGLLLIFLYLDGA